MTINVYDTTSGADNSDANSYGSVADLRAYAALRGIVNLPADPGCDPLLIQAMDYLEAIGDDYQGIRTSDYLNNEGTITPDQPLQWPRAEVYFYNSAVEYDNTLIPQNLINAQYAIACAIAGGVTLYPVATGPGVKLRKVDTIERQFFQPGTPGGGNSDGTPTMPNVDALLAPLLDEGGGFSLTTVRL